MLILYVLVYHRVYNTYYKCLVQQQQYEYITTVYAWYATLCTEHFTCSIFGTTAAVTTGAVVVVLTLTHGYNAVRGHRTGSNNCILPPLFNMHGINTLAVRRSDVFPYPVRTFGFMERRVLLPQAVGRLAVL